MTIEIPIYMRGVTGRMARRQHLERSLMKIRQEGGLKAGSDTLMPAPVLLGRNEEKQAPIAKEYDLPYSTNIETAFEDKSPHRIFFDGAITKVHYDGLSRAIDSGMNVYTEKPITLTVDEALGLVKKAKQAGIHGGVVQDKRYLPGPLALKHVIDQGKLGEVYHIQLEFGYFVHPNDGTRPDWNWDKNEGGGIILDMVAHWDYVLSMLVGRLTRVTAHARKHIEQRSRDGKPVPTTAEDSIYATFETEQGVLCTTVSSWCRRPRKRGLLEIKVQGTEGAAEAYLDRCYMIQNSNTPSISWDPDTAKTVEFDEGWEMVTPPELPTNVFRYQWEKFLRSLVDQDENPATLLDGAQGVETSERTHESDVQGNKPVKIRDVHSLKLT